MALRPRQPFVGLAIAAVVGIGSADLLVAHARVLWQPAAAFAIAGLLLAAGLMVRDRRTLPTRPGEPPPPFRSGTRVVAWIAFAALFFAWHSFGQGAGAARRLAERVPAGGCVVHAVGIVNEEPALDQRFRIRLESVAFGNGSPEPCRAEVLFSGTSTVPLAYGDRIAFAGTARALRPPSNPGGFESAEHRRRQGIFSEVRVRYPKDVQVLAHDTGNPVLALAYRTRHAMERTLARDLEDRPVETALIHCMVLGSRTEEFMHEVQDRFQYTGAIHLYAVTGMNVVLLALILALLLRALSVPLRTAAMALLPAIWAYAFVTGLGASTLRAAVMISVLLIGRILERPAVSWNSLSIATLGVLMCSPGQIFKHGFVFSFLIVAVMMLTTHPLQSRLASLLAPDPFLPRTFRSPAHELWMRLNHKTTEWIASGVTAWLASIPLMAIFFHLWSPATLPANLIGGLLTFPVIAIGLASATVGAVWPWLAATLNNANFALAWALLKVINTAAIPGGYVFVERPALRPPVFEAEALDLAPGAAIHLRARNGPRRDWLVDCGNQRAFSRVVLPYLHSRGVNRLDGMILTHGDAQHLAGAGEALQHFDPAAVFDTGLADRSSHRKAFHTRMEASGLGKTIVARGDTVTLGRGAVLRFLFPPEGFVARSADDKALVLRVDVTPPSGPPRRILFLSDAGFLTEHWLLEHAAPEELRCDVLIKGMHAKDISGTPEFLAVVRPSIVVVACTDFPPSEQVSEAWVAQVRARGVRVLRQDRTGAVRVMVDPDGALRAEGFLGEGR